jgi:hypothetical protein
MESGENKLLDAILSRAPVEGLTHDFYRYPARFSPVLARTLIEHFTQPGETVLDPFVGGGTSLVEARALGRTAIGVDISSLAIFISRVKTTPLRDADISGLEKWLVDLPDRLNLRSTPVPAHDWRVLGYQKNIDDRHTWPIRKTLELGLHAISELPRLRQQRFARCALLKTAQWALDCRKHIPSASRFREDLLVNFGEMLTGAVAFTQAVRRAEYLHGLRGRLSTYCIHRSAVGMESDPNINVLSKPRLVLTSPPYPGVHVLYHRWQVRGRRETPAPFWLASSMDGHGSAFYTFGDRKRQNLTTYWAGMLAAFESIAKSVTPATTVVQIVAFAEPDWQLPEYMSMMERAGFEEIPAPEAVDSDDGRVWREVPNRKWYASQRGTIHASREVVLFHRLRAAS